MKGYSAEIYRDQAAGRVAAPYSAPLVTGLGRRIGVRSFPLFLSFLRQRLSCLAVAVSIYA